MEEITRKRAEAATDKAIAETIAELEANPEKKGERSLEEVINQLLESREDTIEFLMNVGKARDSRPDKTKPLTVILP